MNNFDISRVNLLIYDAVLLFSYTLNARLRKAGANFNNIFSVDLKNEIFGGFQGEIEKSNNAVLLSSYSSLNLQKLQNLNFSLLLPTWKAFGCD